MKIAICQVADTGPLESLVVMLRSADYQCYLPDNNLKNRLRSLGCDTVLDVEGLVKSWGYEQPLSLPFASPELMATADLYVDIKAHRNGSHVWREWPNLREKTLWYRINGGAPEITARGGDEINLICPILTPVLWYGEPGVWSGRSYAKWPPFYRLGDYYARQGRLDVAYAAPMCLVHNLAGWGYGAVVDNMRRLGVRCYGVSSPDGLVNHSEIPHMLSKTLAMVHLKSSDAPGYALYEGLAAACPIVITRRMIWRNMMQSLFEPGVTCLVFDQPTHAGLLPADVVECTREVEGALALLQDPRENKRIGMAGHNRLKEVMWDATKSDDVGSLQLFMERMYGK